MVEIGNKIQIINNNWLKIPKDLYQIIYNDLSYEKSFWKHKKMKTKEGKVYTRKIEKKYTKSFLDKRNGTVLSGFLPRIEKLLKNNNIAYEIDKTEEKLKRQAPKLKGITFEEKQIESIQAIINNKRGIIKAATGFGKTVIAGGIISSFKDCKTLFLCNTIDLLNQSANRFSEYGIGEVSKIGGGNKLETFHHITVSTIQSFSKLDPKDYFDKFDIVIVDEIHHGQSATYRKVLKEILAPIKVGLTATMPDNKEENLWIEGLIGPVIKDITIQQGYEIGRLVMPKIILISTERVLNESKKWQDIYKNGIVRNKNRNRSIIKEARTRTRDGKSVLIMVNELEHGELLSEMGDYPFLTGENKSDERDMIKDLLTEKEIKCVIVTTIWNEGVDLPSLDCVIIASGGKSEKQTLQKIGRGLRASEGKDCCEIIDFLDKGVYLADHAIERIETYIKMGWL